jgi:ankyrin repeat protein
MIFNNTTGNRTAFDELLRAMDSNIFDALQFSNLHKIILNLFTADLEIQLQMSTAEIDLPDSGGQTPLFWAALRGDEKSVITLLKYGADPHYTSNVGEVALHWSIEASDDSCTHRLLEGGADPNARSHFGATALHYAAWTHDDPTKHLQPLVDHGADVNIQSFEGHTPLHYAASVSSDFIAPAEFLLSRGADLEIRDNKGNTPLMEAMRNNLPNVAEYLLQRGANPRGVSKMGENVLHIAAAKGGLRMFRMLDDKGIESVDPHALTLAELTPREILAQRHDRPEGMFEAFEELLKNVRWVPGKEGPEIIGIGESEVAEEGEEENFEDAVEEQDPETPLPQYEKLDMLIQT